MCLVLSDYSYFPVHNIKYYNVFYYIIIIIVIHYYYVCRRYNPARVQSYWIVRFTDAKNVNTFYVYIYVPFFVRRSRTFPVRAVPFTMICIAFVYFFFF